MVDIPIRLRCGALLTAFRRRRSCALVAQLLDPRADRSEIVGGARLGHASSKEEIMTGKIVPRGTPPTKLCDLHPKRNEPDGGTPPGSA